MTRILTSIGLLFCFAAFYIQLGQGSFEPTPKVYVRKLVAPRYPPLARQGLVQGIVTADIQVTGDGKVESVTNLAGPDLLKYECGGAISQWEFVVPSNAAVRFKFTCKYVLEGPEAEANTIYEITGNLPEFIQVKTNPTSEKPSPNVRRIP